MKKALFIIPVILLITYNCKYFKKKEVEIVPVDTIEVDTIVEDTTPVDKDVYLLEEIDDKYLIIVGSFQSVDFAKIHAAKYRHFDLDTKVILKPDGFYMVSAKAFVNKEQAKKEVVGFRKRIAKKSWVFTNQRAVDLASI